VKIWEAPREFTSVFLLAGWRKAGNAGMVFCDRVAELSGAGICLGVQSAMLQPVFHVGRRFRLACLREATRQPSRYSSSFQDFKSATAYFQTSASNFCHKRHYRLTSNESRLATRFRSSAYYFSSSGTVSILGRLYSLRLNEPARWPSA